jgi:hypothetical protein
MSPLTDGVGQPAVDRKARPKGVTVDSWAGRVHVEWDPEAPLTPIGQASFFIEFLKTSGVFDALLADCPLGRHTGAPGADAAERKPIAGHRLRQVAE